ncbi:MAG: flagellin, partial [Planctomycetaceae bacterium]|nr:flagellin [Planctomycetaceae bacterium]
MSGVNGLYVASNPTALSAQFNLVRNMGELANTLTRLSTGLRINSAKDDPAGLIASELLKADIAGTAQAITNIQRGNSMLSTADSAMGNINSLLTDIKALVVGAANTGAMNADQINANQLQVNATLEAIDQIATSTTYGGQKILDGSMDFTTNANLTGGLSDVTVTSANFGTGNSIGVNINVYQAANRGALIYNGTGVNQRTTLDITGSVGTKSITVGTNGQFTSNQQIADAINTVADSTGVSAFVEGKAARGSVVLSSTGANNDIVITATEEGLDAGNYSFRITQGVGDNSARIVKEAVNGQQGVVEISLKTSYEQNFANVAGLFDVNVNTGEIGAARSISFTRGNANSAVFHENASDAKGNFGNMSISGSVTGTGHNSDLNGWTVKVDNSKATAPANTVADINTKTLYINTASTTAHVQDGLGIALGNTIGGALPPVVTLNIIGNNQAVGAYVSGSSFVNGDTFVLGGGADAGEITVTYKEGATAGDIQKLLNNIEGVTASLKTGVSGSQLIPVLPTGQTYMTKAAGAATASKYASSVSASEVVALINSQLGDKFNAQMMTGDNGSGKVNFMDAYALHGDFNFDNMLRFSGMDNGPVVRLTNLDSNGQKVANQALSVEIKHPSATDIKAGIHTPILEIHLATDAAGNSITTAQDIAKLFDSLSAAQTLGVSAEVVAPPGVDINGRIWTTDSCGNAQVIESCGSMWGLGIVQPTSGQGVCGAIEGDIALLGSNQSIADDFAVARIASGNAITPQNALTDDGDAIEIENSSALNGVTFKFTTDETKEGFVVNGEGETATGTLTIYVSPSLAGGGADVMQKIIAGAIAANWESIRGYTGATGEPITFDKITVGGDVANVNTALSTAVGNTDGYTIPKTTSGENTGAGTAGVGIDDPALIIKAKTAGTDMAGIKIHFVNDPSKGLATSTASDVAEPATGVIPDISVEFQTKSDGSRELIVYANIEGGGALNAADLAAALNTNAVFKDLFVALPTLGGAAGDPEADRDANTVLFNSAHAIEQTTYQTVGGYKVVSKNEAGTTSSGLNMIGQSDSNERLIIVATDVGSENFAKVTVREGSFDTYSPNGFRANEAVGSDAIATVNGLAASARGNVISLNTAHLALSVNTNGMVGSTGFDITGG